MNLRRYIKIILITGTLIAIATGTYFFWKNYSPATIAPDVGDAEQILKPTAEIEKRGTQKISQLTKAGAQNYWLNNSNNSIYYINSFRQDIKTANGNETLANSQNLTNLNELLPSFGGKFAVAKFNYPELPTFSLFDTTSETWSPLPAGIISAAWSPNSEELAYL